MFIKNPGDGLIPKKPGDMHKTKLRSHAYKAGHRLPVLAAAELLSGKKRRWIMDQLTHLSHLDEEYYQVTYAEFVVNFAEYVQIVPMYMTAYLGSLLNESLGMGFASLHHHLHQPEGHVLNKIAPDPLLGFAIFSAGLLLNLARMATNQRIMLTTEDGSFLRTWNPMAGSLKDFGDFYKLRFVHDAYAGVNYALTILLARQIMPPVAFEWLSSDELIFSEWLNALRGTTNLGGRVAAALDAAKEKEAFLQQLLHELSLEQHDVEQLNCPETEYGEAFYQWLVNNVENNRLKMNTSDADLHVVAAGVFIEAKLIKQFTDVYGVSGISPNVVMAQFGNLMGIVKKSGQDSLFSQYFSDYPETRGGTHSLSSSLSAFGASARAHQARTGFLINDARLIFRQATPPNATNYMKPMNAEAVNTKLAALAAHLNPLHPSFNPNHK